MHIYNTENWRLTWVFSTIESDFALVRQSYPARYGAEVVAQMGYTCGLDAREDSPASVRHVAGEGDENWFLSSIATMDWPTIDELIGASFQRTIYNSIGDVANMADGFGVSVEALV